MRSDAWFSSRTWLRLVAKTQWSLHRRLRVRVAHPSEATERGLSADGGANAPSGG